MMTSLHTFKKSRRLIPALTLGAVFLVQTPASANFCAQHFHHSEPCFLEKELSEKASEKKREPASNGSMEGIEESTHPTVSHLKDITDGAKDFLKKRSEELIEEIKKQTSHCETPKLSLKQLRVLQNVRDSHLRFFQDEILNRILRPFEHLEPERALNFIIPLLSLLFDQQLENPPHYVSHGADHSVLVAESMRNLANHVKDLSHEIQKRYGIEESDVELVLFTLGLTHDLGYAGLEGEPKVFHGPRGAFLFAKVMDPFLDLLESKKTNRTSLSRDFLRAIHLHSADKKERSYTVKIEATGLPFLTTRNGVIPLIDYLQNAGLTIETVWFNKLESKNYLATDLGKRKIFSLKLNKKPFFGRVVRHVHSSNRPAFGLEYTVADLIKDPLPAAIRLADNMDILPKRLSPIQVHPAFERIYEVLGNQVGVSRFLHHAELAEQTKDSQWQKNLRSLADENSSWLSTEEWNATRSAKELTEKLTEKVILHVLEKEFPDLSELERFQICLATQRLDSNEYAHFAGLRPIQDIEFQTTNHELSLTVLVDRQTALTLNKVHILESKITEHGEKLRFPVGIGHYQQYRLEDALNSIQFDSKQILLRTQYVGAPTKENTPNFNPSAAADFH